MKDIHVIALTPYEFDYYESIEKALRDSLSLDYDSKTKKAIVKVKKSIIEKLIKDHEAFAEIPEEAIEIIWK